MAPDTSPPGSPHQPTLADGRGRPHPDGRDRHYPPTDATVDHVPTVDNLPPDAPRTLGNYDVLAKVAEGGMGTVYRARHRFTGDVVAVKVISPGPARNPVVLQRFEREFLAAKVLEHPNVVRAIEYCGTGPHPFLVMEYVDGESLGQRVEREGAFPEAEAVRLIGLVCDGLQRAHKQGLVHRDVKPDNVMVNREGVAKLTDLGLVKDVENDLNLTKTGRGLGTPHYMAPEQFRNAKNVDVRCDIYSLGATLYAIVTGTVPFSNCSPLDCWLKKVRNELPAPREVNPAVSERVDWAIRRAMSAEPAERPASCREFFEDLTGVSRPGSGPTTRPSQNGSASDVWYLVYKDETGKQHSVKGGTGAIRDALRDGLLGDASTIVVGRSKAGQFQPLHSVPEFRDLVLGSGPLSGVYRTNKTSKSIPPPGARPRHPDSGAVDIGGMPAGADPASSRSGRNPPVPAPASGRMPPAPPPRASGVVGRATRPTPPRVAQPTPYAMMDPSAETMAAGSSRTPPPRPTQPAPAPAPRVGKKPFDWTPVIAVAAMVVSAVVGFLVFNR